MWPFSIRTKPGWCSADLTLASGFGLCFHCKLGSSSVLRRPIETTRQIGSYDSDRSGHVVLADGIITSKRNDTNVPRQSAISVPEPCVAISTCRFPRPERHSLGCPRRASRISHALTFHVVLAPASDVPAGFLSHRHLRRNRMAPAFFRSAVSLLPRNLHHYRGGGRRPAPLKVLHVHHAQPLDRETSDSYSPVPNDRKFPPRPYPEASCARTPLPGSIAA